MSFELHDTLLNCKWPHSLSPGLSLSLCTHNYVDLLLLYMVVVATLLHKSQAHIYIYIYIYIYMLAGKKITYIWCTYVDQVFSAL
jgi:hypothetical protein